MGIRAQLEQSRSVRLLLIVGPFVVLLWMIIYSCWPQKKADLSKAFYTVDDGKTWFVDSVYRFAPFEKDGRTAVIAEVFSYDSGKKTFCAYLARLNASAQKKLKASVAEAAAQGKPPESVSLLHDPKFLSKAMEVKLPGDTQWIPIDDVKARTHVMPIHSPDGSPADQCFVY
jgi:hypothetical protein